MTVLMRDSKKIFVYLLCIWCLINQIAIVNCSSTWQLVAIPFAVAALIILVYYSLIHTEDTLNFPGVGFGVLLTLGSAITLLTNHFTTMMGNAYAIAALAINFILLYSCNYDIDYKKVLIVVSRIIAIGSSLLTTVSLIMLSYRVVIPVPTTSRQGVIIMGLDFFHERFTGIANNPNALGQIAISALLTCFLLLVFDTKVKEKVAYKITLVICVCIQVICLFLVESRGDLFSMWAGSMVSLITYILITPKYAKKTFAKAICILVIMCITVLGLKYLPIFGKEIVNAYPYISQSNNEIIWFESEKELINNNVDTTSSLISRVETEQQLLESDPSNGRWSLLTTAVKATAHVNPVFGVSYSGADSIVKDYAKAQGVQLPDYLFRLLGNSHNTVIQVFVCYGLFGTVSLMLLFYFFAKCIFKVFNLRITATQALEITAFILIFAVCAILSMVESTFLLSFDNNLLNFLLMLCMGFFVKYVNEEFGKDILADKISENIQSMMVRLISSIKMITSCNRS